MKKHLFSMLIVLTMMLVILPKTVWAMEAEEAGNSTDTPVLTEDGNEEESSLGESYGSKARAAGGHLIYVSNSGTAGAGAASDTNPTNLRAAVAYINTQADDGVEYVISLVDDIVDNNYSSNLLTRNTTRVLGNGHTITPKGHFGASGSAVLHLGDGNDSLTIKVAGSNAPVYLTNGARGYMYDGVSVTTTDLYNYAAAIRIDQGAEFTMEGGEVYGIGGDEGAVLADANGTFIMNGGSIHDCEPEWGAAVTLTEGGNAVIKDGEITNNSAYNGGGAICVFQTIDGTNGANLVIDGPVVISNNYARHGGAIYISEDSTMQIGGGAVITGNTARGCGGGILILSKEAISIGDVTITGNTCGDAGGGIYIENDAEDADEQTVVTITEDAVITNNKAKNYGGGLFAYGNVSVIHRGGKLCNNHASAAGDDIYLWEGVAAVLDPIGDGWMMDGTGTDGLDNGCEHAITGWFADAEGDRWLQEGRNRTSVEVNEPDGAQSNIAVKAAHPFIPYTYNLSYSIVENGEITGDFGETVINTVYQDHYSADVNAMIDTSLYNQCGDLTYRFVNGEILKKDGAAVTTLTPGENDQAVVSFNRQENEEYTINLVYQLNGYHVSFDSDGGSEVAAKQIIEGNTVSEPDDPEREGYAFAGWQLNGADYDFTAAVNDDITLKAKWIDLNPKPEDKPQTDDSDIKDEPTSKDNETVEQPQTAAPVSVPNTGDPSHLGYWLVLLVISVGGIAGTFLLGRKN